MLNLRHLRLGNFPIWSAVNFKRKLPSFYNRLTKSQKDEMLAYTLSIYERGVEDAASFQTSMKGDNDGKL